MLQGTIPRESRASGLGLETREVRPDWFFFVSRLPFGTGGATIRAQSTTNEPRTDGYPTDLGPYELHSTNKTPHDSVTVKGVHHESTIPFACCS